MEIRNLKEFKKLIKTYQSITKKQIEEHDVRYPFEALTKITGYGGTTTCTLCTVRKDNSHCNGCIYCEIIGGNFACLNGSSNKTYNKIAFAETNDELLIAINNRANYMKKLLKENNLK